METNLNLSDAIGDVPVGRPGKKIIRAGRAIAGKTGLAAALVASATLYSWGVFDETFLFAGVLILILFPIALRAAAGRFDFFEPLVIWITIYSLAYWLRALLMWEDFEAFAGPSIRQSSLGPDAIKMGLGAAFVGLLAFYGGYFGGFGARVARLLPPMGGAWRRRRVDTTIVASGWIFGLFWYYFIRKGQFDLEYMYLNRGAIVRGDTEAFFLMMIAQFLFTLLLFCRLLDRLPKLYRSFVFLVPILTLIPFMAFGSRGMGMWAVVPCFIVWHYTVRPFRGWEVGLFAIAAVMLSIVWGAFRGTASFEPWAGASVRDLVWYEVLGQFSYWDNLLLVLNFYPREHGFYHGRIMLEDLLWLIPRNIWSGKPQFYGSTRVQNDLLPNLLDPWTSLGTYEAFSPLGYGYADFGIPGIVLAMFVQGVVWRAVYEYFRGQGSSRGAAVFYGMAIANLPGITRGFMSSLLYFPAFFGPLYLSLRFLTGGGGGRVVRRAAGPTTSVKRTSDG